MGSGIPQVVRALDDELTPDERSFLVSLRVSLHKIGLVAGGLLAGLSIGREGPTVQVGAGVMVHARRWLSPHSGIDGHDLMVAGAAAGIAAAFNTPLGGIIFALEQLSRRRSVSHSALVIVSIVLAGLVAVAFFGNNTYFGELRVQHLGWSLLGPGLLVALVAGLAGGLFSRLVVVSARGLPDRFSAGARTTRCASPAGCAFVVAVIGLVTGGTTAGAGYAHDGGASRRPGRAAAALHAAQVLRHLAVGLDRCAGGVFRALAGHRRGHRQRRRAAHSCRARGRDPAHRAGHGRLPGGHHARPDHGLHHRHGDGLGPREWC